MTTFLKDWENLLLILVILASAFLLIFGSSNFTGYITQGNIPSNVSVSRYLAISFGTVLSQGIEFGTVTFLPATNVNATHNYNGTLNSTLYTILVSNDSNANVDFCIKANHGLQDAALDVIGIGNETYAAYNMTNATYPQLSAEIPLNTSYVKAINNTAIGNSSYWRFWLDVPVAQPAGDYNNSVSFEGVTHGVGC